MAFFRDFMTGFLKKPINQYPLDEVVEVKLEDYIKHQICQREDCILLYGLAEIDHYEVVLQKYQQTGYSLCRRKTKQEGEQVVDQLKDMIPPIANTSPNLITVDTMQDVLNYILENPKHSFYHMCAYFNFVDSLKVNLNGSNSMNLLDEKQRTPLHVAIERNNLQTVQYLLTLNVNLTLCDKDGNNVIHLASKQSKEMLQCICNSLLQVSPVDESPSATNVANNNNSFSSQSSLSSSSSIDKSPNRKSLLSRFINAVNNDGFTPLHLACLADKPDCVKELLKFGADVNGASIKDKQSSDASIHSHIIDQLETRDMKNGGTPLHWSKSPQCLEPLLEMGCDINAKNFQGESVLFLMVSKFRLPCLITLLSYGADVNALGPNGNTALHIAVKSGDVAIVQALVVFGANVNIENSSGETPRHIAATSKKSANQDMILYILHTVGAKRCKKILSSQSQCNDGCAINCFFNGNPLESSPFNRIVNMSDSLLSQLQVKAAVAKKEKEMLSSSDVMEIDHTEDAKSKDVNLLTLDGGGVRGLILIQMLSVIEDLMGRKATELFQWISGTSTGGILALYMAIGNSASDCRRLYFRLKDKVFVGSRPYDSEPLEKFLQKELGEDAKMSDITKPRVTLTATVADKFPADIFLFRNYDSPEEILGNIDIDKKSTPFGSGEVFPKPNEQLLWMAGRSTGAAPTYFRASGRFLDGGLISNNPTLDALTEIVQYNACLEAAGRASEKVNLKLVVSLGTGSIPSSSMPIIDIFRPDSLVGVAKIAFMASSLGKLLIEQASQSNGQVVERAKAWCNSINVPFFRMNPPISENINIDETNNAKLINMLWETTAYMYNRKKELNDLRILLM